MPNLIEQVSERLPEVALVIDSYTSVEIAEHLRRSVLDLGLLMGPVLAAGIVSRDLCTLACEWVASPDLDLPDGSLEMQDIAHLRVLSYPRDSQPHATISRLVRSAGGDETRVLCAPLGTMIRLAVNGAGVAAIPAAAIKGELCSGALRSLKLRRHFRRFQLRPPTFRRRTAFCLLLSSKSQPKSRQTSVATLIQSWTGAANAQSRSASS